MRFLLKKMAEKLAQAPGTLTHIGERRVEAVTISELRYNQQTVEEREIDLSEGYSPGDDFKGVIWLNVIGIHDTSIIETLGGAFGIHSLVQEDILNTFQRPKIEEFDDHFFMVLKMLGYDGETREITSEQVSLVTGSNFVITFQEREGDVFQPVRERIRKKGGKIRQRGSDYLSYALMDAVVDHYFIVMEAIGGDIEAVESELIENPGPNTLHVIQKLRKELVYLRKGVWPLREILNTILHGELKSFAKTTLPYLRDVYDHSIQVIETTETFRDLVSGLQDLYLSSVSHRMNEVMQVLTIIATIFIPLTFIAGIYGMNFEFMPELKWRFGYLSVWILMGIIAVGMVLYFKRKKWW